MAELCCAGWRNWLESREGAHLLGYTKSQVCVGFDSKTRRFLVKTEGTGYYIAEFSSLGQGVDWNFENKRVYRVMGDWEFCVSDDGWTCRLRSRSALDR